MDTIDILKVCIRRWYVMLPILLGAAGVCYQLVQAQQTTYTAAASYGWVQPELTPQGEDTTPNPLGSAGDVLIGEALEAQLNSRETQAELGGEETRGWGPGSTANGRSYTVEIPEFESTYEVRAWGEDPQEVRDVVDRVVEAAPDVADELQVRAKVPLEQRYQPFVLAPTQVDTLPAAGWVKISIAVMGVGLLMGAAWSVVVDRVVNGRRERRRAASGSAEVPASTRAVPREPNGPTERPVEGAVDSPADHPGDRPGDRPVDTHADDRAVGRGGSGGRVAVRSNAADPRTASGEPRGRR